MSLSVALPQQGYYCHQCDHAITIAAPASRDDKVFCPVCAGGFVEELFDDEEPPNPIPHHQPHPSPFFPFSSFLDLRNPSDLAFDVHLGDLLSGGATIQIVLEGSSFPSRFVTFGAGGVSLLIQQLAENDPSRYGTLPAAKAAVAALPDVAVDGGRPAPQQAESSDQDAAGYGDYKNDGNASGRSYDDLD
ncbi:hypothetical protein VPH35_033355 [Triticum aestivum]